MRIEIEKFLESAPTYFDAAAHYLKGPREEPLKLPFSLEDLVQECADRNLAVTWLVDSKRTDLLKVHEPGKPYSYITHPTIIDNGDEGIKIWEDDIPKLRTLLTGQPREVEIDDLKQVYDREGERLNGLLIVSLNPDIGFGQFIEQYPRHEGHYLTDDTSEHDNFAPGFDEVALDPRFYGQLERFLKRRDLVKAHQMIDLVARFSQTSGNLIVGIMGEDIYFWKFLELKKDEGDEPVIGFMTRKNNDHSL